MEKKREEEERRKKEAEEERRREKEKKERERIAKEQEDRDRKAKEREEKLEEERMLQEKLFQDRQIRQAKLEQAYEKSLQQQDINLEMSLAAVDLEKSGLMNDSDFVNGDDKEKLKQMELISDITKDSSKYEAFMKERMLCLKPIINYWKQGRINNALDLVQS